MHSEAKHKQKDWRHILLPKSIRRVHVGVAGGTILVLALVILGFSALNANVYDCSSDPAEKLNIGEHSGIVRHIHFFLSISIFGREYTIPSGVGIRQNWMSPIHTHDSSGQIHVEAPCSRDFYLSDFFSIWNKTFNKTCIFEFCTNNTNSLRVLRNGFEVRDFETLLLEDHDYIRILYG